MTTSASIITPAGRIPNRDCAETRMKEIFEYCRSYAEDLTKAPQPLLRGATGTENPCVDSDCAGGNRQGVRVIYGPAQSCCTVWNASISGGKMATAET